MIFEAPDASLTDSPGFSRPAFTTRGGDSALVSDCQAAAFDPVRLRTSRLARLREMMRAEELAAVVLFDPYNQRYATGSRNMFGYFLRNSTRYIYVPVAGNIILFEYPGSAHVSTWLETIDEHRTSKVVWSSVNSRDGQTAAPFAAEIADLVRADGGGATRIGLDRCFHLLAQALEGQGLTITDCQQQILHTRRLKTPDEIACLTMSMGGTEVAVARVAGAIAPGISENELFAEMYHGVIEGNGEFIETRLLSSGPRTNPWFNEASGRCVRPGDLIALDTDTIGCNGYYADFSRTFFCGPGRPSGYQKQLYGMAYEQIQHNISILKPGMSYREIADLAWPIPERFYDQRYPSIIHGVGMHGETPLIAHARDFDTFSGDGILEPGMVASVESYIGAAGARDGVKLEDEILVTETGVEVISRYPFDDDLLVREF
jgi:Xaa-Pro aminopeptidase